VKDTSGGMDKGARPICEGRFADAEKDLEGTTGKAGRRNEGREMDIGEATALSSPLARAVENIANVRCCCSLRNTRLALNFGKSAGRRDPGVRT
jgi:hypothetical protein